MFEILLIGLFVGGAIYVVFFLIYSTIKAEKDFALDVYRYLSRRYPRTVIIDYGGISSDPIIQSRDAGPFKLIEVKVVSEKAASGTDQDLILRGEVDPQKFQKGGKSANLSLSPQLRWGKIGQDIIIGVPRLDDRFIISCNDTIFPRYILSQTDLGYLIQKSFDLEGYFIRWMGDSPVIQIRMETMSSNSFIQAFNILLGTIGILSEKGYLTRSDIKKQQVNIPSYTPTTHEEKKPLIHASEGYQKPTYLIDQAKPKQENNITKFEETKKQKEAIISWEPPPSVSTEINKPIEKELPENPLKALFTSIQYQTKKIDYEPDRVRILTFSRTTEEIIVTFPEENHTLFTTSVDRMPLSDFELQIEYQGQARQTDWSDAWKDINILGSPDIIEKLRIRTGIAHRITSTGETIIIVKGHPDTKIECKIKVPKTIRGINSGYSLLKDITWFIEMVFM
ncbi:MAG: hypothetical protein ACFFFH_08060 [Candidatus Thorarchaeota archaeon]